MFFLWLQTIILFLRLQPVKLTELSKVNRHRCQTRLFYFPWKVYILAIHGFHWTATICKWQLVVSSRSPHQVCAYLMESVSVRVHAFVLWTTSAQVFEFVQTILVCNVYLLACACIPELQYSNVCVCVWQSMFTCAGELLGRRGEQQFVGHVTGPGTAGNARLLVAALHPVWQPLHVAVTVQRVGTQSPASQKESHRRVRTFLSHDDRKHSKVSTLTSESLFHFRFNVLNYRAKTKDVSLSKYCHTE